MMIDFDSDLKAITDNGQRIESFAAKIHSVHKFRFLFQKAKRKDAVSSFQSFRWLIPLAQAAETAFRSTEMNYLISSVALSESFNSKQGSGWWPSYEVRNSIQSTGKPFRKTVGKKKSVTKRAKVS